VARELLIFDQLREDRTGGAAFRFRVARGLERRQHVLR
jgi:hypothetical protein